MGGEFVVTIWRDWLTDAVLSDLEIDDRQKLAIRYMKEKSRINNTESRELVKISMRNAKSGPH